jgi:hypothetical protein
MLQNDSSTRELPESDGFSSRVEIIRRYAGRDILPQIAVGRRQRSEHSRSNNYHFILLICAIFAMYLPAISMPSLYADDYLFLCEPYPASDVMAAFSMMGRPLAACYLIVCGCIINGPWGNELCHALGVAGAMLLAASTYRWLRKCSLTPSESLFVSFLIVALPGVQIYVAWITAGSFSLAAVVSTWAIIVFDRRHEAVKPESRSLGWWWYAHVGLSSALLIVAHMIYQPAAMYFWALAIAGVLLPTTSPKEVSRRGGAYLLLGLTSMAIYVAGLKLLLALTGYGINDRATTVSLSALPAKLTWFLNEPVQNSLSAWMLYPQVPVSIAIFAVLVVGVFGRAIQQVRAAARVDGEQLRPAARWLWALCVPTLAGFMAVLCYSYNLVIAEKWASYRTTFPLAATAVICAYVSLRLFTGGKIASIRNYVLAGCCVLALVSASNNVYQKIVFPQVVEFRFLQSQLDRSDLHEKSQIHVIRAGWPGICAAWRYDEFGRPSSLAPWVPEPMVRRALNEMNIRSEGLTISHGEGTVGIPEGPHVVVVDMREITKLRSRIRRY